MDSSTKLAVILGCSLGGAAVIIAIIILVSICCCCCRKKQRASKSEPTRTVDDSGSNIYTTQKPGMPPFYPPVIGGGSQQWKKSPSMTAQSPTIVPVDAEGPRPNQLPRIAFNPAAELSPQTQLVSNQQYNHGGWYQRTVGRAKQFFNNSNSVFDTRRESDGRVDNISQLEQRQYGANSAYALNRKAQGPVSDKRISENNSNGSQTTLIYQDYNSSSLDSNGGLVNAFSVSHDHQVTASALNDRPYASSSTPDYNQQRSTDSTINSIIPMFPSVSAPITSNIMRNASGVSGDPAHNVNDARSGMNNFTSSAENMNMDMQDSRQITDSGQVFPDRVIAGRALNRERPASIMPPQRILNESTPYDNRHMGENDARMNVQAVETPRITSEYGKNTIDEAFQFLEALDE